MPEGDTIWLHARRLGAALAGAPLTRSDFRVSGLATTDLTGAPVLAVRSRGKHLLIEVGGGLTVHSHLGMEGTWRLGGPGRRPPGGPEHELRVELATASHRAAGYRLRRLALWPTATESARLGHLGPDLLGPDWDPGEALRRLTAEPDRPVGEALLDQRNLAGIGNFYKAELLFLVGVHPFAPVGSVPRPARLIELAHRLLLANRHRWEQVSTGVNRPGERSYVFERAGRPCRRCGAPVAHARQGQPPTDRVSYWCPACQPAAG